MSIFETIGDCYVIFGTAVFTAQLLYYAYNGYKDALHKQQQPVEQLGIPGVRED